MKKTARPKERLFRRLFAYIRPDLGYCVLALLLSVANVAGTLYAPVLIGDAINLITPAGVDWSRMLVLLIALGATVALACGFGYLFTVSTGVISQRAAQRIRNDCLAKIQTCELRFIDGTPHGDILSRIGVDTDVVTDGLLQGVTQLFSGITTVLGTIGFMLWVDIPTAIVVICVTPFSLVVSLLIARYGHKIFARQSELRGKVGGLVAETFVNQKLIKLFRYEDDVEARFDALNAELDAVGTKAQFAGAMVNPCTRFANGLVYTAVAVFGGLMIIKGSSGMNVGELSTFLLYANQYTRPFNDISTVAAELASAAASARRIFAVTDAPVETETGEAELDSVRGEVRLEHVVFGYTPERPLMRDLNLSVRPGMRVAIVGPTGCGKSTLINLLMRFYDPQSGAVLVDGTDVRDVTRKSLRTSYGMVLQETWLANATVAENIAYGAPDATFEQIVAASKAAHCHRFIRLLPDGYDTVLGDEGGNLSVGQKQLLCIARVMLLDPPMLILDEATSNIDTRTETHIQHAFERMTADKTSFVVAHRFSTILDADLILVMRDGNIVEKGTHETLMRQNGFYAELYRSQFSAQAALPPD